MQVLCGDLMLMGREPEIKVCGHSGLRQRLGGCVKGAIKPAVKTGLWLLAITVPVSFGVLLLKVSGLLPAIARLFEPLFALFALPGEAALVFVTSCLVNIYSAIAVIETLGLTGRVVTILALMCLISHNLPVEGAVQKRLGSKLVPLLLVRLSASFAGAFVLNVLLPPDSEPAAVARLTDAVAAVEVGPEFTLWLKGISLLCVKIMVLVTLLMILQRILEEFGITHFLSRLLRVPLLLLGVPHEAAFLWIVANTLGLAYGAGVIIDHVDRGRLSRRSADILNFHIGISHSLLEDTCLFVAIGVPALWIIVPRVLLAGIVVWLKRAAGCIRRWAVPGLVVTVGLVSCGCTRLPVQLLDAQVQTAIEGQGAATVRHEAALPAVERRIIRQFTLPDGGQAWVLLFRDMSEPWFRVRVRMNRAGNCTVLRHQCMRPARGARASGPLHYVCRGWLGSERRLPGGWAVRLTERIRMADGRPLMERALVDVPDAGGMRYLPMPPLESRRLALPSDGCAVVRVEYDIELRCGDEPAELGVYLSPQVMTEAEWVKEREARSKIERLVALDDTPAMRRFAQLFFDESGDYVMAFLPKDGRMHCYLQAALVRDWYRLVTQREPGIHARLRMTGIRRSPAWQSSNLITPRNGRTVASYVQRKDGVVLDTWRVDGGIHTKVQTIREFRKHINLLRLEETVAADEGQE